MPSTLVRACSHAPPINGSRHVTTRHRSTMHCCAGGERAQRRAARAPAASAGAWHGGVGACSLRARACRARPGAAAGRAPRRRALPEGQHAGLAARRLGAVGVQVCHLLQRRAALGRGRRRGRARALGPAGAAQRRAAGRVRARAGALWLAWRHCGCTRGATSAWAVNKPLCAAGAAAHAAPRRARRARRQSRTGAAVSACLRNGRFFLV
jgi:hypothetical protein